MPARLAEQLVEDRLDRGEVRVVVEMLLLDVQHDGVLGMVEGERAVALVAFRDEVFARPDPSCAFVPRIGISAPT